MWPAASSDWPLSYALQQALLQVYVLLMPAALAGDGHGFIPSVRRQLYTTKIEELRRMEDLWHSRRPPEALNLDALLPHEANGSSGSAEPPAKGSACKSLGLTDAHAVWDVRQNACVFLAAVQAFLDERADELGTAQVGSAWCCPRCWLASCQSHWSCSPGLLLFWAPWQPHKSRPCCCCCTPQFDKDDQLAVEFVTAASNLRAACYGIPVQSLFVTKASRPGVGVVCSGPC